jgi:hypothetical protein
MEEKFAGFVVKVDDVTVAKVTSLTMNNLTISEADITGSEDVVNGGDILAQKFASLAVNEVANVEGIVWVGDAGQSDLKTAARQGATVEVSAVNAQGNGASLEGFFTGYQESRGTGDVAKFSSAFRVNENTPIVNGS